MDVSFYEQQAIKRNLPLTVGIGSPEIDRNSIDDLEAAKAETAEKARRHVAAVKRSARRSICRRTIMWANPGRAKSTSRTSMASRSSTWSRSSSMRSIRARGSKVRFQNDARQCRYPHQLCAGQNCVLTPLPPWSLEKSKTGCLSATAEVHPACLPCRRCQGLADLTNAF